MPNSMIVVVSYCQRVKKISSFSKKSKLLRQRLIFSVRHRVKCEKSDMEKVASMQALFADNF